MGREVRHVPASWKHPKHEYGRQKGNLIPLLNSKFEDDLTSWKKGKEKWDGGLAFSYASDSWIPKTPEDGKDYEEEYGSVPVESDYMPNWSEDEATHFQMYETTSEGTPISPPCRSPEELASWLVKNGANSFASQTSSYGAWLRVAQGGFAPSAVKHGNGELISGVSGFPEGED